MSTDLYQRIVYSDNGVLTDYSLDLQDFKSRSIQIPDFNFAEDALYIGSYLPFNHKFFELSELNANNAKLIFEIWWSHDWTVAFDILDDTSVSNVSLAKSGIVRWQTDDEKGWDREEHSYDVTGLENSNIYWRYWSRVRFEDPAETSLTSITLNYIGHKFADDTDLYVFYPDLDNQILRDRFKTGATTWDQQHFAAADLIARMLRAKNILTTRDQILNSELFQIIAVHKTAEIIYGGMGTAYFDDKQEAARQFQRAFNMQIRDIDYDGNAILSDTERRTSSWVLSR